MVCSCAMPSNSIWLQIFCSCVKETVPFSFLRSLLRSLRFPRIFIEKTNSVANLNSVVAKYRDLSVSRRSIICLSLRLRQIIDLLATDKSRYFAQPRPIIVNCRDHSVNNVNYTYMSIFAMNLLFNHSFLSTNMSPKHQMLQTTKMKFGKLLG